MTDISEIFTPAPTLNTTPTYTDSTSGADAMGKEDFLTLLVAQLQNQDPMNPDDPTEFTAQLAQFSSLEQLFNLNESIDGMVGSQQESDRLSSLELIGKEIVYPGSDLTFNGDSVNVGYQLDGTATSVTMYIQDEQGETITTFHPTELQKGEHFLKWDGLDSDGNEVPHGKYTLVLEAKAAGEDATIAASPLVQSEVTGVDFSNDGDAILHTLAGAEVGTSSIIGVYQADKTITSVNESEEEDSIVEEAEEAILDEVIDEITSDVAGTSTSQPPEESAYTDEEQIEQDSLQHYLAG